MKRLSVLFAAILIFASCNKDNSETPAPNLSPDGKQWIIEWASSPEGLCLFWDFTIGGGKAYSTILYPRLVYIYSGFYFYQEDRLPSYSCEKSDNGTYSIVMNGTTEYTFKPYSEDTGIISWKDKDKTQNRFCRTLSNYVDVKFSPVSYSDYNWVIMAFGEENEVGIVTNKDGAENFKKLNGSYSCEVLTGNGEEADYDGKDVKGKIVFVSDGDSISFSKKREIAAEKEAAALIVYHYDANSEDDDHRMIPYLETFGSVPSGEGLPCGVINGLASDVVTIANSGNVSFPKG